jgi:WD40 repeat protein
MGSVRFRHPGHCGHLCFLPGGKGLLSQGNQTALWDAKTGQELYIAGKTLASSTTAQVAEWGQKGIVTIRDMLSGKAISHFNGLGILQIPGSRSLSPGGEFLACKSKGTTIRLYETKTGKVVHTLRGQAYSVSCLAFSPDGNLLASGEYDDAPDRDLPDNKPHTAYLWDVRTGKLLHKLPGHENNILSVTFSPDSKTLAVTGSFYQVRLWDTATGKALSRMGDSRTAYREVAFSPDRKTLAMSFLRTVVLWDMATSRQLRVVGEANLFTHFSPLAFSADGKVLAGVAEDASSLVLFDVATGKELPVHPGHRKAVVRAIASPDGKVVATASLDGTIRLWDITSGKELRRFGDGKNQLFELLFTPDGKTLISGGEGGDLDDRCYTIRLWDVATGKERGVLTTLRTGRRTIAGSEDGKTLAVGNHQGVRLWDLASRKESSLLAGQEKDATYLALSPDGKTLAVGSAHNRRGSAENRSIRLWDVTTGKRKGTLAHNRFGVHALAFAPGGRVLAAGCQGEVLQLWDVATEKVLHDIKAERNCTVWAVVFSPDGRLLATVEGAERQAPVVLRETATGGKLAVLDGHRHRIRSIAFTPDGSCLVTGSADATALVWDLGRVPELRGLEGRSDEKELHRLWTTLREKNARDAYQAVWRLGRKPHEATAMLGRHLLPSPARDVRRIRQLVADLDSDTLATRQHAFKELRKLSPLANPELRKAMDNRPSAEVRRSVRALLAFPQRDDEDPERLREVRAIQALERIGSPEARALLKKLAMGEPVAPRTRDAREALQRLEQRARKP